MKLFSWFKRRIDQDADPLLYVALPPERTTSARDGAIHAREHYVRLWLTEMFLAKDRQWFREWHPAVHALVRARHGDQDVDVPYIAGPMKLPGLDEAGLGRTLHLNHALTPLMPYGGGSVELAAGLLAVKGSSDVSRLIGTLGRFADLLMIPQLSSALQVAGPLADSVEGLLSAGSGELDLGLHQTLVSEGGGGANVLREGYFAVIRGSEDDLDPERLWVVDDRLRRGPSLGANAPLSGFSYMLFRMERRSERDAWSGLTRISEPYRRALTAFEEGDAERGAAYMRQAVFAALDDPSLTWVDGRRIAERLQHELDWLQRFSNGMPMPVSGDGVPGDGVPGDSVPGDGVLESAAKTGRYGARPTLDALRDDRVLSANAARALGPPSFREFGVVPGREPDDLTPRFEAFAIEFAVPVRADDIPGRVAAEIGTGWAAAPYGDEGAAFELLNDDADLSESEAWDAAYRLRLLDEVAYAEPLFEVAVFEAPEALDPLHPSEGALEGSRGKTHLDESDDPEWGLKMTRVLDVWTDRFEDDPTRAGKDVVIGHPDTGYRRHPEVEASLLVDRGYDFVRDDVDAEDELTKAFRVIIDNPGHGVQTSSVIISRPGPQDDYGNADPLHRAVSGVAPGARLIPIRTSRTVVLLSMRKLARSIEHAVRQGAHVISISMGGVPSRRLRSAVRSARNRGVIVCAAAGNQVRFVVWPANYTDVVACAACNAQKKPWKDSSRGSAVDVTAPGESVWRAHAIRDDDLPEGARYDVGRGSGTSYAVAHVAGLAALWLSHHGRDSLVQTYGAERLPGVFRHVLVETCEAIDTLDDRYGAGLVRADRLLNAPLPDLASTDPFEALPDDLPDDEAPSPMRDLQALFDIDQEPAEDRGSLEGARRPDPARRAGDALRRSLSRVLQCAPEVVDTVVDEVGDELVFHLMTRPRDFDRLRQAMRAPEPASVGGALEGAQTGDAAERETLLQDVRDDLRGVARSARLRQMLSEP